MALYGLQEDHSKLERGSNGAALSVTSHSNCIVARWPDKRCLSHGMCLYQVIMTLHFLIKSSMTLNRHENR